MNRLIVLALGLLTACSSGSPAERSTVVHEPEAAPSPEPSPSPEPTPSADPAATAEGYLCAHDRCPVVPPGCPVGQIPSVQGEGGCYGPCVPFDECACDADDDCGPIHGATCGAARRCIIDCNASHARNPVRPPPCPAGEVLSVNGVAWGPCVALTLCSCTTFDDCPRITGLSEVCDTAGHCGPAL